MADLQSGQPCPTRACLEWLLETLEQHAAALTASEELRHAATLLTRSGAAAQRAVAADGGPSAVPRWLAERFLDSWPG